MEVIIMKRRFLFGLLFLLAIPHSGQRLVYAEGFNIQIKNFEFGPDHSILEDVDGKFYALGESRSYALLGNEQSLTTVTDKTTVLPLQAEETIVHYDVGYDFNIFLTSTGRVLTSGRNDSGQLGNNTLSYGSAIPVDITNQFNLDATVEETVINVIASFSNPVVVNAITSEGRVFTWGANPTTDDVENDVVNYGFATGKNLSGRTDVEAIQSPFELDVSETFPGLLVNEKIIDIEYFEVGGFALTSRGGVYAWGKNENGILGIGEGDPQFIAPPTRITSLESDFYLGDEYTIDMEYANGQMVLLTNQDRFLAWGKNELKQLTSADDSVLNSPQVLDLLTLTLSENETIHDFHVADYGIYLVTNLGQIWMRGYTIISSIASFSSTFATEYRANKYWLNVTAEMPFLSQDEFIMEITGYNSSFLFITNTGKLITQYNYPLKGLMIGRNTNFVTAQYDNATYKVFINEETEPYIEVQSGDPFTLPKLDAEPGFYHSGWAFDRAATSGFPIDYVFTMNFESNFRIFALYTEGEDPNASSQTVSSETTTSQTSSTTTNSSTPTGSEPETSEPSGPRASSALPIVVGVTTTAALGGGIYYFGFRGGAVGGFSLASLKHWFLAIIKRKKDKEDDDQNGKK
jgi:alpha-tubulin suppressor-like RCC1 family protein